MPCIPAQSRAPTCPQPRAMAPLGPGLGSGPSCPPQSPGASPPHPKTGSEGAASPRLPPPAARTYRGSAPRPRRSSPGSGRPVTVKRAEGEGKGRAAPPWRLGSHSWARVGNFVLLAQLFGGDLAGHRSLPAAWRQRARVQAPQAPGALGTQPAGPTSPVGTQDPVLLSPGAQKPAAAAEAAGGASWKSHGSGTLGTAVQTPSSTAASSNRATPQPCVSTERSPWCHIREICVFPA